MHFRLKTRRVVVNVFSSTIHTTPIKRPTISSPTKTFINTFKSGHSNDLYQSNVDMLKSSKYVDANFDKVMNDRRKHVGFQNPDTLTEICYHEINRNDSDNKELFLCFFLSLFS